MKHNTVMLVYNCSPMMGRGTPFTSGIFSWFRECKYIKKLTADLKKVSQWRAILDPTEADIYKIKDMAEVIVCVPGLKFQFYTGDFDKRNIIYLSTMEYANLDTKRVIKLISRLSGK